MRHSSGILVRAPPRIGSSRSDRPDVHIGLSALSPDAAQLERVLARARTAYEELDGVTAIWRLDCHALPTDTEAFGFRDGISHPAIEGSGIPGSNPRERPIKAGEFLLGYPNERGELPSMPRPEVLGRNGTYVVFRKLHQRVAAFRQYLAANSSSPDEENLLAAKMMGRWQSGAPLALCPTRDDPSWEPIRPATTTSSSRRTIRTA